MDSALRSGYLKVPRDIARHTKEHCLDPICHTLVGATLSRAGLHRWTTRATATLILAANAPDVDIVAAFVGRNLEWRRGLTHGVPALLIWPWIIAAAVTLWDRWRSDRPTTRWWGLVGIAAIGVITHPFLDYLNSYGMRWLMPMDDRWFYGDTLYIVDPWLYLLLGGSLLLGRIARGRGRDPDRPARVALALSALYVGAMLAGTLVARGTVARETPTANRVMASPVPIYPLRRQVITEDGRRFRRGMVSATPGSAVTWGDEIAKEADAADIFAAARESREGRAFLHWARFPAIAPGESPGRIRIYDLRYSDGSSPSWASFELSWPASR